MHQKPILWRPRKRTSSSWHCLSQSLDWCWLCQWRLVYSRGWKTTAKRDIGVEICYLLFKLSKWTLICNAFSQGLHEFHENRHSGPQHCRHSPLQLLFSWRRPHRVFRDEDGSGDVPPHPDVLIHLGGVAILCGNAPYAPLHQVKFEKDIWSNCK